MYSLCSMQILYLLSAWQTAGIVTTNSILKYFSLKKFQTSQK